MRKKRLGDLLQDHGLVDELQLRAALSHHQKWGTPLGQVVVDMHFCSARQVLELLASQAQLPTVDLDAEFLDPQLVDVLPVGVAEACRVIPLREEGPRNSVLVVATVAPADPLALDEVARRAGKTRVVTLLATDAALSQAIERLYYPHLLDARRPVEAIPLPEADAAMPLVTERSACLMMEEQLQRQASVSVADASGLPVMLPLTNEAPASQRLTEPELRLVDVALAAPLASPEAESKAEPEVWVYGWGMKATRGLCDLLEESGLRVRVGRTEDVRKASTRTVVLAPLQSVESVKRRGVRAQLVLMGRSRDTARAQELKAVAFLSGPLHAEQLVEAVCEGLRAGRESLRRVG